MRGRRALQQRHLLLVVHDELEVLLCGFEKLSCVEHAFEQHDRRTDARTAQRDPFFQPRDGEGIRIRESQGSRNKSMAVGVGLDHRHHASACRVTAHHGEIGSQRTGVDHRAYQPRHLTIPSP